MGPFRMKRAAPALLVALAILVVPLAGAAAQPGTPAAPAAALDAAQVEQTIRRVADWQLEHPYDFPAGHWTMAPLYDGLIDAGLVLGEPRYLAAVIAEGRSVTYDMKPSRDDPTAVGTSQVADAVIARMGEGA